MSQEFGPDPHIQRCGGGQVVPEENDVVLDDAQGR
jgi:hypothetical protein